MRKQAFRIEWDAPEYEPKERNADWFWAVGIVTVSLAIVSIIFSNLILALLIILSVFSLSLYINRPPEIVHVVVDERGITRGKIHYPYSSLRSYWLDETRQYKKILLRSEKLLMPLIVIPVSDEVDVEKLERNLQEFLEEEYHILPFAERVLEYLGF